jgi:exodeoxyribonuclease I
MAAVRLVSRGRGRANSGLRNERCPHSFLSRDRKVDRPGLAPKHNGDRVGDVMRFVFYDTETTGTNTSFDQILQFAAIYTDEHFNEVDRLEVRSRLMPHIVPAPGALLTNHLTVERLEDRRSPSHYGMMRTIQAKLRAWSPAVFIGYNSLRFDEHIFREALYQTLHPPYLTNTGGNSRSDAMKMVQAASIFAPDAIVIPLNGAGAATFKLELVAAANGFEEHNAHDALGDVEATIHLCKLVRERALRLWTTFVRFNRKLPVQNLLRYEPVVCLTEFYGGPYSWLVTAIGRNADDDSEVCVVDLAESPEELSLMTDEELLACVRKSPKPVRWVRTNSCPMLMPSEAATEIAKAKQLGAEEVQRRARAYRTNRLLRERLTNVAFAEREPRTPSVHVERQIYEGFFSDEDQELMFAFHNTPWEQRFELSQGLKDPRLQRIARRLLFIEAPGCVPAEMRSGHEREFAARLLAEQAEWLTLPKAIEETADMLKTANEEAKPFLIEYKAYLEQRLNHEIAKAA